MTATTETHPPPTAPAAELVREACEDPETSRSLLTHVRIKLHVTQSDAEDVVQEVIVRALKSRERYDPELASVRSWLRGISFNVVRELYRDRERQAEQAPEGDSWATTADADAVGTVDLATHARRVMDRLNPAHRDVIRLRVMDDLPFGEVAARLRVSRDNARKMLSRGLEQLRTLLAREERGMA